MKKLFIILLMVTLYGCGQASNEAAFAGDNTPEAAAIKFFDRLYHSKNLNSVYEFATPEMVELMESYHTNRNVQRHVVNLSYDRVRLDIDPGRTIGLNKYADETTVTVFFDGEIHDKKVQDLRAVKMVQLKGKWKVAEINEIF